MKSIQNSYLFSNRGIYHADHLRRTGDLDYARRVTEANLQISEQQHWAYTLACAIVSLAIWILIQAITIRPRPLQVRAQDCAEYFTSSCLIEALLARGRFFAKTAVGAGSSDPITDNP